MSRMLTSAKMGTLAGITALTLAGCMGGFLPTAKESKVEEAQCPPHAESIAAQNDATYQIFGQGEFVDADTGEVQTASIFLGTAWGVGDHLLATNGHITELFKDLAEKEGIQFSRAVAVQAGTGETVELLKAVTHPLYRGDYMDQPDVGLFTTLQSVPAKLPLAPAGSILSPGDEFDLVGFPGDVDRVITTEPGLTVPQATSLSGTVTAVRSYDTQSKVTSENIDYYQHQAPTTGGTSGSSMMNCGVVVAVNNAGTVNWVLDADGVPTAQEAASNNFGVHVRHLSSLIELFDARAVAEFEVPVKAVATDTGRDDEDKEDDQIGESVRFLGAFDDYPDIVLEFDIFVDTGEITGFVDWSGDYYELTGMFDFENAEFEMMDDGALYDLETGLYVGFINEDMTFQGEYIGEQDNHYSFSGDLWE